jgi:hypothetical protein
MPGAELVLAFASAFASSGALLAGAAPALVVRGVSARRRLLLRSSGRPMPVHPRYSALGWFFAQSLRAIKLNLAIMCRWVGENVRMEPSEVPDEIVAGLCGDFTWNSPVTFIAAEELTPTEQSQVPPVWLEALRASGRAGVGLMLDEWERVLPGRLPRLTARFRAAGVDLILGRQSGVPVLVYVLTGQFGDRQYCCWTATPPVSAVPEHLRELPRDVTVFHSRLHDELESPWRGGMMPIADMEPVSIYYDPSWPFEMYPSVEGWSTGPRLPAPVEQPDWSQVVLVHNDRGPRRLCATLGAGPDSTAGWYWFEGSMSPEPNIWEALDFLLEAAADWSNDD